MSEANSTTQIEYRPIEGFPGYRVGSDGSVWTEKRRGKVTYGSGVALARKFGVSELMVIKVRNRESWKHVSIDNEP